MLSNLQKSAISAIICLSILTLQCLASGQINKVGQKFFHLNDNVEIKWQNEVLAITAKTDNDLYFAQGYATVSSDYANRLFEMDYYTRLVNGKLSEIVGSRGVTTDAYFRTYNLSGSVEKKYQTIDQESKKMLQSFIEGVNSYLEKFNRSITIEEQLLQYRITNFSNSDPLRILSYLSFGLSQVSNSELLRFQLENIQGLNASYIDGVLFSQYPKNAPTIIDDNDVSRINFSAPLVPAPFLFTKKSRDIRDLTNEDFQRNDTFANFDKLKLTDLIAGKYQHINIPKAASNAWTVGKSFTVFKKSILANDPHLPITLPSLFIVFSLKSNNLDVKGSSIAGLPLITIGENKYIKWGITNSFADTQDLYLLDMIDSTHYNHNNEIYQLTTQIEIINVAGENPVYLPVQTSIYGPVLSNLIEDIAASGLVISTRWTGLNYPDNSIGGFRKLSFAQNFVEFRYALHEVQSPSLSFVYSDEKSNIGYQMTGLIPVRPSYINGGRIVPGATIYDWIGYIPSQQLPWSYNPPKDYIVSCNNKVAPDSYPYLIINNYDWEYPFRAERITDLIKSSRLQTIIYHRNIQTDRVIVLWTKYLRNKVKQIPNNLLTPLAIQYKNSLLDWNGDLQPNSRISAFYEWWIFQLGTFAPQTGFVRWINPITFANLLPLSFLAQQIESALNRTGRVPLSQFPTWGAIHPLSINHLLISNDTQQPLYPYVNFTRSIPDGGDSWTVNAAYLPYQYTVDDDARFTTTNGPSYRQLFQSNNPLGDWWILPTGQSGDPTNRKYDNLLSLYKNGLYLGF